MRTEEKMLELVSGLKLKYKEGLPKLLDQGVDYDFEKSALSLCTFAMGLSHKGVSYPGSILHMTGGKKCYARVRKHEGFAYKEVGVHVSSKEDLALKFLDFLSKAMLLSLEQDNLDELNRLIRCTSLSTANYSIAFQVDARKTKAGLLSITDHEIVFKVESETARSLIEKGYSPETETCKAKIKELVNFMQVYSTPPQILKSHVEILDELAGMRTKARANKLIRKAYHRKAENLFSIKAGWGYVQKEIEYDGETITVFAILKKHKDGSITVDLSPFDVRTLFSVDYELDVKGVA